MAIRALSKRNRNYVLKEDRRSERPTVFHIRTLDRYEVSDLNDRLPEKMNQSKRVDEFFKLGLLGWEDFPDEEGNPTPFSHANFSLLSMGAANELFNEIAGIVTESEAKNSGGQSGSASGLEIPPPTPISGTADSVSIKS